MRFIESDSSCHHIVQLTHSIDEDQLILRWQWPRDIQYVYICKEPADCPVNPEELAPKLYTKEEYKANNGFRDRTDAFDRYLYTVYPCLEQEGGLVALRQQDGANTLYSSTRKHQIFYSLKQRKSLFHKYKTVSMEIRTDHPISKEVLCYVKKEGAIPRNKEDGTLFSFVQDFQPGRNVLPDIDVGRDDYVRLFLTDGKSYGPIYELILS